MASDAAPTPSSMERFGITPHTAAQDPPAASDPCGCCVHPVADYWKAEAEAEKAVNEKMLAKLVVTADELVKEQELHVSTGMQLTQSTVDLKDTQTSLGEAQGDLGQAKEMIEDFEAELKTTRESLGYRQKAAAETRWNFAAKHQKMETFKEKLEFQSAMRKKLVEKTVAQRTELIKEVEAERAAQLVAAEERMRDVTALKTEHATHLATVISEQKKRMDAMETDFTEKINALLEMLQEDLEDAQADAKLSGLVRTGGAHPAVERMKARKAASEAKAETTGALVVSEAKSKAKTADAAAEADAVATAAFERIDKDGSGTLSRIEIIQACKIDPGVRSLLGIPAAIRQEDGSRDALELVFQAIDKDGSKAITLAEFLGTFGGAPGAAGDGKTAAMLMLTNEMATAEEATPAVTPEAAIAAFGMRLGSLGKVPPTVKADSMADAMGVEAVSAVSAPAEEGI